MRLPTIGRNRTILAVCLIVGMPVCAMIGVWLDVIEIFHMYFGFAANTFGVMIGVGIQAGKDRKDKKDRAEQPKE